MSFVWMNDGIRVPEQEVSKLKVTKTARVDSISPVSQALPVFLTFADRLAYGKYQKDQHPVPEHPKLILAQDIMTSPVITLPSSTTLTQAWAKICDHRFRHIPIVNAEGHPVGILSDRSLLREVVRLGRDISHSDDSQDPVQTIGNIVAAPVLTALPHASIHQIAKILFENHIGAMPIINDEDHLVGIITRSDILRALIHLGPLDLWG